MAYNTSNTALSPMEQGSRAVSYEAGGQKINLDIDFVRKYLVRGNAQISDQEALIFLWTAANNKLNPFTNDIYCIKFGSEPAQVVVGKNAYVRRAYENPDYVCKEDGITVMRKTGEVVQKEGTCLYPNETLIGGWCRVHYMRAGKERTCFKEVALSEFNKGQANWRSKPAVMICKVAMSQALRDAFPSDYQNLYSQDEMEASGAIPVGAANLEPGDGMGHNAPRSNGQPAPAQPIPVDVKVVDPPKATGPADPPITQEQRQSLFRAVQGVYKDRAAANAALKALISEEGYSSTDGMPKSVFLRVMDKILATIDTPAAEPEQASV